MITCNHDWSDSCPDTFLHCCPGFLSRRIHHGNQSKKCQRLFVRKSQYLLCCIHWFICKCQNTKTIFREFLILQFNFFSVFFRYRNNFPMLLYTADSLKKHIHCTFCNHGRTFLQIMKRRHHLSIAVKRNLTTSWVFFSYYFSRSAQFISLVNESCLSRISNFLSIFIGRVIAKNAVTEQLFL